mmetsp:Transcript_9398/g.13794  ORF Transcript_9398/g.13794 Transcript_9398/m.13794 type:complete len:278 (-) Transcript_9398:60-893(-)|eukprot:CAMPEP_0197239210 /NCGR_PEP_ID=MMETSP1429-20130617/5715_1 /TAXON_ID=49237 /ORGANISM="Chaetoceros  sp., Strain UNC1202" /LENGTH=277 /DNA_ID=CAMNT_0042698589 /DNA_START=15 /DNA_END=848 /DNA_ORIENTATION=+
MADTTTDGGKSPSSKTLFDLSNRTALVTGGGTGIGSALAKGLAKAGAKVVLVGRREAPLVATADAINTAVGQEVAFPLPADILDYDGHRSLVERAKELTGRPVTILLNNAGVNVRQKATDLTPAHWQQSLDLMLTAPFFLARACSEGFASEGYGRIMNVASLQTHQAFPDSIPYASAKSGLLGLTRALAEYFAPAHGFANVTCNSIGPGYVATELTKSVFEDEARAKRLAEATILGRNSVPEDLVGTAVYLSSQASSYVTGQTIMVDGGFTSLGLRS